MTNETFIQHQETLGLNNRQLAEKLGANEGSVSKWRKDMPIPDYIAGYLELLVTVYQNAIPLTLTLGQILHLSKRAEAARLSFADYIIRLIRADLAAPVTDYSRLSSPASSRLNDDEPGEAPSSKRAS